MHPLKQKIATLQRRLVWQQRGAAVCRIAALTLATALALGAVDYVLRISDPGLRIIATFALAAAATWAIYRWWYLPNRRPLHPLAVAQRIESHFPHLRDALTSSIEFLEQSEDDATAGSAQLRRHVITHAQTEAEGLDLDGVIDRQPLRRAARWLAVVFAMLAFCIAWDASTVGIALARLVAPLGATAWPRDNHLAFRNVPKRLAAGQTFEVELIDTAGPLPDDVRIEYRFATDVGRRTISETMTRAGDVMIARRENVRESFAFRATGGDDDTMRWNWVEVVEPPQLESLVVTVHPPAYTRLPAVSAERHLEVLAGTGIAVSGTAREPLGAARILIDDQKPIMATITADVAGDERPAFQVAPQDFVARASGPYRLELADPDGLAGVVGQWNLRVLQDEPPNISWRWPSDNLYVVARAVLPIELIVSDDLAVHRVDLVYKNSNEASSKQVGDSSPFRIELYRGPHQAMPSTGRTKQAAPSTRGPEQPAPAVATGNQGENRVIELAWDLAPLNLLVGAQLSVHAEAADYRPGVGRTVGPRRITIITDNELQARLADRQAQIVRQLERALAMQRTTRQEVQRLEIQLQGADTLADDDRNLLQSVELNQQRVARTLVNPAEGVPPLARALLHEIETNRLPAAELRISIERLLDELARLSSEPLNIAERELIEARKMVKSAIRTPQLARSLAAAAGAQDEVITTLQRLLAELSGRVDFRRVVQQLAELREQQLAHEQSVRKEIGLETLPLQLNELSRRQLANLNHAAASQNAIADRFGQIEQSMTSLADELADENSDAAARLADAVALARRLTIGSTMRDSARNFSENRVGQALARESKIVVDLQQVLDVLRNEQAKRPGNVVAQLREAEKQLAKLREQLAELRAEIAQTEQQADTASDQQQLAQLQKQEQSLQREIEQLSRQLDRLEAADASRSTHSAANRLGNSSSRQNQAQQDSPRPSPSGDVQQAERDLEQAAEQLAQRRQEAENNLALEFVRRFQAELTQMVASQRQVILETAKVDGQRQSNEKLTPAAGQVIEKLVHKERELAQMAREHSEFLRDLAAVRISLEEAERRLAMAAELLENSHTGLAAQAAEQHALARLEGMLEAFAQTASEAAPTQPPPAGTGNADGQPPQRRPTFELLEVKMLRMLQVDLNERTRNHQERLAAVSGQPAQRQQAEMAREARQLQAEQARLAELVQEMLTRDNGGAK